MSDTQPSEPGPPIPVVPDPLRAGDGPVRWKQVAAGFGIAFAVMFVIRIVLMLAAMVLYGNDGYEVLIAAFVVWYVPIPVLVFLIWRNARRGRKGRAIGMAIYAGLAALAITGCWAAVANG